MKRLFAIILLTTFISAVPYLNLQGRLSSPSGTPLSGTYPFVFTIYNVQSGGTALWSETQTLSIVNGVFSANLGATTPISLSFNEDYWVEISSNGQVFNQRVRLTTSPYAFIANNLTSPSGPVGANDLVKKSGDTILGNLVVNGNVGIGTNTPAGTFDVESSSPYAAIQGKTTGNGGVGIRGTASNNFGVYGVSTSSTGVGGISTTGAGVHGNSPNNYGVYGTSTSSTGVGGTSTSGVGVYGISSGSYAVYGTSTSSIGVVGTSVSGVAVYGNSPSSYGVYGVSTTSNGVVGTSTSANGVYGHSTNLYGVYAQTGAATGVGVLAHGPSSGYARMAYGTYSLHGDGNIYTGGSIQSGGDVIAGGNAYASDVYLRGAGKWASTLVTSCKLCVYTIPGGNAAVCPPAGESCAPVNSYTSSIWANQACYFMWKLQC